MINEMQPHHFYAADMGALFLLLGSFSIYPAMSLVLGLPAFIWYCRLLWKDFRGKGD